MGSETGSILVLEKEFGTEISDEDAEKLITVGQVIEYIKSKVKL